MVADDDGEQRMFLNERCQRASEEFDPLGVVAGLGGGCSRRLGFLQSAANHDIEVD